MFGNGIVNVMNRSSGSFLDFFGDLIDTLASVIDDLVGTVLFRQLDRTSSDSDDAVSCFLCELGNVDSDGRSSSID